MTKSQTSELEDFLNEAAEEPSQLDSASLGEVATLANRQLLLELRKQSLTEQLSEVSTELRDLSERLLPESMSELGLSELRLKDGTLLQVLPFYSAKIKAELKAKAMTWLKRHHHADVIKTEVVVPFDKGDVKMAEVLKKELRKAGQKLATVTYSVHAQTLKKLAREVHEAGESLPSELFDVYIGRVSKLSKK